MTRRLLSHILAAFLAALLCSVLIVWLHVLTPEGP